MFPRLLLAHAVLLTLATSDFERIESRAVISQATAPKEQHHEQEPNDNQRKSNPRTATDSSEQQTKSGAEPDKNQKKCRIYKVLQWLGRWTERHDKFVVAASTFVIAAFTVVLSAVTGLLWWSGERQSRRALRAYIFVSECYIEPLTINGPIEAVVTIENAGQTPAYNISTLSGVWTDKPKSPTFAVKKIIPPVASLGPEGQTTIDPESDNVLNDAERTEIGCGRQAIYVGTEIKYRDIFGKKRRTRHKVYFINNDPTFQLDRKMLPATTEDKNDYT